MTLTYQYPVVYFYGDDEEDSEIIQLKKRRDNRSHRFCFLNSKIYTLSGINESCAIIHLCVFRAVLEFIKSATRPMGATITSTRRAIAPGATERAVFRAIECAVTTKGTFTVVITFQRHFTFMCKHTMQFDFFSNRGFVFADSLGDGSLGGIVSNTSKNDSPFV